MRRTATVEEFLKNRTWEHLRAVAEMVAEAEADVLRQRRTLHRVIREVYDRGESAAEIADAVGMSRASVHRIVQPGEDL